jgi:hypothetical protein
MEFILIFGMSLVRKAPEYAQADSSFADGTNIKSECLCPVCRFAPSCTRDGNIGKSRCIATRLRSVLTEA